MQPRIISGGRAGEHSLTRNPPNPYPRRPNAEGDPDRSNPATRSPLEGASNPVTRLRGPAYCRFWGTSLGRTLVLLTSQHSGAAGTHNGRFRDQNLRISTDSSAGREISQRGRVNNITVTVRGVAGGRVEPLRASGAEEEALVSVRFSTLFAREEATCTDSGARQIRPTKWLTGSLRRGLL